jgi:hypothetical protein
MPGIIVRRTRWLAAAGGCDEALMGRSEHHREDGVEGAMQTPDGVRERTQPQPRGGRAAAAARGPLPRRLRPPG